MSFSIGFQLDSVPSDDRLAIQQFGIYADRLTVDQKPDPRFVALHDELTARHPCLCDLSDDEVDDSIWADGPLINNFGSNVAVIRIVWSAVDTAGEFLITTALKHGATVFDLQSGSVWRPD